MEITDKAIIAAYKSNPTALSRVATLLLHALENGPTATGYFVGKLVETEHTLNLVKSSEDDPAIRYRKPN